MPYPGVYPDDDKIIPHSPRKRFGFASTTSGNDKVIKLESMKNMSIDQIVELYRDGYRIDASPTIVAAQEGIYIGTGALLLVGIIAIIYFLKSKVKT